MYKYLQKKQSKHDHKCKQQLTGGIFCNLGAVRHVRYFNHISFSFRYVL